jgi:hypothetical protein
MPEEPRNTFRYRILRYTPNLVRDEWVNIGVLLEEIPNGPHEPNTAGRRAIRLVEEDSEIARIRRLHPSADEVLLRALPGEFDARLGASQDEVDKYLEKLEQTISNALQFSPTKGLLAEDFDAEMSRLFRDHVAVPPSVKGIGRSVRNWIRARMEDVFKRRRIMSKLEHRVSVEQFTHAGDPLKLDYGYRYNGARGYLHAIALDRDASQAKVLAYTAECIRKQAQNSIFTAVTEVDAVRENPRHQFIVQTLTDEKIVVLPLSQLEKFAEKLRPRLQ